jgi:cellulose synthase/poly-beta-1,6-N-acetylglucosamine synthase-like glycosyltransferase
MSRSNAIAKWLIAAITLAVLAWAISFLVALIVTLVLVTLAVMSTFQAAMEYRWRNYTSRTPDAKEATRFPAPRQPVDGNTPLDLTTFSVIVPAYHEASVIAHSLEVLVSSSYPRDRFEILATLRDDDPETYAEAQRIADLYPDIIRVFTNTFGPDDNKSTQMNAVLEYAKGEYITPMDAESIAAPDLLSHVDALIHETNADVVQGGVQLTNFDTKHDGSWFDRLRQYIVSGWFAVHNVLEYRFWFSSRMFYQQKLNFVPLGGNTVFIRKALLEQAGNWDDTKLTEDAALGVVLSTNFNAKIVAAYTPELTTREHTPPRVFKKGGMFWQRVRWDQGFLQVLIQIIKTGQWKLLPTVRQRLMAFYILLTPLLQALSGVMMPLALVAVLFLKAPLPLTMLLFVPFVPLTLTLLTQVLELREFSREFGIPAKPRHYLSLILGFFPYQFLLGMAAIVGVIREVRGINTWSKTARNEAFHRQQSVPVSN